MKRDEAIKALVDALPGNVWRADNAGREVVLDRSLLRIAGLGEHAMNNGRWLSAIFEKDLVAGALVWHPYEADSPVSTTSFRLKSADGGQIPLVVLVVPIITAQEKDDGWVGTFFRERDDPNPSEFVAAVLLERIAKIGGFAAARPSGIAPLPLHDLTHNIDPPRSRPVAIFLGYDPAQMEALDLLLDVLDWHIIKASQITADLASKATIIFVNNLGQLPSGMPKPFDKAPTVVALAEEHAPLRDEMLTSGCIILNIPISMDAAEQIIVSAQSQN